MDNIDTKVLKAIIHISAAPSASLYNVRIDHSTFPKLFKKAEIVPIYKAKGKFNVEI